MCRVSSHKNSIVYTTVSKLIEKQYTTLQVTGDGNDISIKPTLIQYNMGFFRKCMSLMGIDFDIISMNIESAEKIVQESEDVSTVVRSANQSYRGD